ncbi:CrcB family protein, partial [Psychrobacter sp. 1Y4]|uniref:CrcB family protein n=1 Tax=Psychrobacter sp. 1Y4 TaxID=3453575 RepID=UPI003F487FC0
MQWLAIGLGAALGACLRAWLSRFNALNSWVPLGTLSANILGGLLIGLALVWFERMGSNLSDHV